MAFKLPDPIDPTPLMQQALAQKLALLQQPTAMQTLAPIIGQAFGNVVQGANQGLQHGMDLAKAAKEKRSVDEARMAYSQYLSKVDAGTATPIDHQMGVNAALSLGMQPPKPGVAGDIWGQIQKEGGFTSQASGTPENVQAGEVLARLKDKTKDFAARAKEARQAALDKSNEKRLAAFGDILDPSKGRAGAFGVSKQKYDRAEALETLATAYKDGNYDSRQIEELAIGLNALLSGSNAGAATQVSALVPKTAIGNFQKMREWLINEPQGANQQAFVQRMMGTVAREKATAADQIKRTQLQRSVRFQDLEKTSPQEFYNQLQAYGISPEEYRAWRKGGHTPLSAVQAQEGAAPAAGTKSGRFIVEPL